MECALCKIKYVDKCETPFKLRLNNGRRNINEPNEIPYCNHFKTHGHKFMKHVKFS